MSEIQPYPIWQTDSGAFGMPKDVITSEVSFAQHLARLQRRLRQVEKLAPQEKRQAATLLDAFIERAQFKQARR